MERKTEPVRCDQWRGGLCLALMDLPGPTVYCPRERAENAGRGECCHHPFREARERLTEMKRAGVGLHRYGKKLLDPAFVAKLHAAFLKARSR